MISRHYRFQTCTARRQYDKVARVHPLATLSQFSWYSLHSMDTKRERTELFINRIIFFLC